MKNNNKTKYTKCTACGELCPESDGRKKGHRFLCGQCRYEYEFCDICEKILKNHHVCTFEGEDPGSFCANCLPVECPSEHTNHGQRKVKLHINDERFCDNCLKK